VLSLNPIPAESTFWIVIVTDPNAEGVANRQTRNAKTINEDFFMDA
jgi:hypothetical protein